MKKILLTIACLSLTFVTGCSRGDTSSSLEQSSVLENRNLSIIAPEGTPSLCLANFYQQNKNLFNIFDIKSGSDPLVAAFTSMSHDIIVAPTNLGAKLGKGNYVLYQTVVWGNLYIANSEGITSFEQLNNKEVVVFGGTSSIVVNALKKYYDININLTTVDSVATANGLLTAGSNSIIVSAEPSLTNLKKKLPNISVIDLQDEWQKMSNSSSYPQASIFFKSSLKNQIDDVLLKMTESVETTISNPSNSAENAVSMYKGFEKLGQETLTSAIPNCHYGIDENQKAAIEYYFNKLNELGLAAQYGGELPSEEFYYTI